MVARLRVEFPRSFNAALPGAAANNKTPTTARQSCNQNTLTTQGAEDTEKILVKKTSLFFSVFSVASVVKNLRALVSMGLVLDAEADRIAALGATAREPGPTVPRVTRSQWMQE